MLKRKSKRVLSIVLAVAMIVGLFPIAAFAEDKTAETSGQSDITLQDKINNAESGATIILDSDVEIESLTFAEDKNITLDLGTHTLTVTSGTDATDQIGSLKAGILNKGTLTITNGTIQGKANANLLVNQGSITLADNVSVEKIAASGNTVVNLGGTVVSAADITVTTGSFEINGQSNITYDALVTYGGIVTINGGDIVSQNGCAFTVFNRGYDNESEGSNVTINGGSLKAGVFVLSTNNVLSGGNTPSNVTINGGSFTTTGNATAIYWPSAGTLTVGTINGDNSAVTITANAGSAIEVCSGTLIVNSGTLKGSDSNDALNKSLEMASQYRKHSGCAGVGDAITVIAHRGAGYNTAALNVVINGGIFNSSDNYAVRYFDCNQVESASQIAQDVDVTINGGTFTGSTQGGAIDATVVATDDQKFIFGGTFSSNVNQYVPEGNKWDYSTGAVVIDEAEAVASVNGVGYTSLQKAINAAPAGGTVTLVRDFTLNAPTGLSDGEGAVLIEKNITIDGNNKTITAGSGFDVIKNNQEKISRGKYHVFNIQNAGNVVIKDLTIEVKSEAADSVPRSGINIWSPTSATTLTVENVTVNNCSTYGLTASGTNVDVVLNGLTTNGNGWGGVNIDTKNGGDVALAVTNADLNEVSSIVFDKGDGASKDPVATINGGNFENLVVNEGAESTKLLINGGRFNPNAATPSGGTVIDIEKHLASGLEYNPWTGEVYKEPEYNGKYSYEIFTKVGDNGTIDVDRYATEGDDVTITVSPDEAYLLDELTVTANGKEVEVKDNGDGTYTFKMPSADAKIVVTFAEDPDWEPEPEEPAMPFTDVNEGDWFYDVVLYAYDNGLMTGVSATEFAPNQTTTRGMIVSMLARLEGVTSAESAGFTDVADNDWYATAVNWAASEGIVNGFEDDTFRPNAPITREQMAAILYNYADYKGYDVSARADLSDYADAASISSWAEDVLAWANAEGLINGMTATTIDPQGATTRAQTAAMFERFLTAHEA